MRAFPSFCRWLLVLWVFGGTSWGVMFYSTADSTHNATVPGTVEGVDAGGVWQMAGHFNGFLGTPIGPSHFITAKHIGGTVGDVITFGDGPNAGTYTTTEYQDGTGDLRIWKIAATFPQYAECYAGSEESGKNLIVIGRGTQRGEGYLGPDAAVRGWQWGAGDGVKRWGENRVDSVASLGGSDFLVASFSSDGGPNEAMLSTGDSGGTVLLQEAGQWKLAGINYAVSGAYYSNTGASGSGVQSGIFDTRDLYSSGNNSEFTSCGSWEGSGSFYATRLSSEKAWIQSVVGPSLTQAAWREHYFGDADNAGDGADTADPDGDGVVNLLEYAFGSSPREAAQTVVPTMGVSENRLTLTFPLLRGGLTYTVEASSDLAVWGEVSYTAVTPGQAQTVTDSTTLGAGVKRFLRVRVSVGP